MPHVKQFCRFDHPGGVRPRVMVLRISDRVNELRVGGVRIKPKVTHGLEVHCPECHGESWIALASSLRAESWTGPTRCSCGETSQVTASVG